jgi:DNA invertase Pin-like site-specific DNA recombinase
MLIGYMRVSKADGSQATDLQRDALIAAGVDPVHLYEDQASGMREDRPGLTSCLKALRTGDTLVVWKLDRLGRDLRHLINTVHDLTGRGIGLKVLTGHGAAIDTTTAAGKLVFGIFAALAEFERELIAERTIAGLASARARGRKGGRPFKMTAAKLRLAMAAMGQPETKVGDLCQELGVTRQTLYRHVSPGTVAKLAMRQPFVLFKGLTFQKLCLPGAFRPGDHHNKMLRPGLCVMHASPQYL